MGSGRAVLESVLELELVGRAPPPEGICTARGRREGDRYLHILMSWMCFLCILTKISTVPNFLGGPWDGFSGF